MVAAARAATEILIGHSFKPNQSLDLPNREEEISVPISKAILFSGGCQAIAISHCNSCAGIDLTRDLEVWVFVEWISPKDDDLENWLELVPGMGVGTLGPGGETCISDFALQLLRRNLRSLVPSGRCLRVEVVIPKGRELAQRTSNEAFGVVEGLALIGTQAEIQSSASPEKLKENLYLLRDQCNRSDFGGSLTFVIGENGLALVKQLGLDSQPILKVGNWLGPLLVAAAESGVKELLLFGYHGKLVKLAGGIFHTHHHLADGRIEVLTSLAIKENLPIDLIEVINQSVSIEEALIAVESVNSDLASKLWFRIASEVEKRSTKYLANYGIWPISIGSALFDRRRRLRWTGKNGARQLLALGGCLEDFS